MFLNISPTLYNYTLSCNLIKDVIATFQNLTGFELIKGAEATCVKIAIEMKKCSRLKEMSNFNVL